MCPVTIYPCTPRNPWHVFNESRFEICSNGGSPSSYFAVLSFQSLQRTAVEKESSTSFQTDPICNLLCFYLNSKTVPLRKGRILFTTFSTAKVNRCFGGSYHLRLQGRVNQARNQHEARNKQSFSLVYSSNLKTEAICSPKWRLTFTEL
jgi:hypothetical protein